MTTVLMITCKKFEQVWNPFFILFKKYWSDCPYRLIMGTDFGSYEGVETIAVGKDLGWTRNCMHILEQINDDRVITFFEDFLPCEQFDTKRIEYLVQHTYNYDIACLRLFPCPGPTAPWEHDCSLGVLQKGDPYRFSWQSAIWNKRVLLDLLLPDETPWNTEILCGERTNNVLQPFVSVKRGDSPTPYICTAIVKGTWLDSSIEFLKREGIPTNKITKKIV